jgi:hypothetical protein
MKNAAVAVKDFVVANKTKILVTALVVTTTSVVLMRTGIAQHNQFLKDHDLYDEFYALTED